MLISNFWHVFAAVLPALVILFYVYQQDQFPEPKNIVFKTFIFGCSIVIFLNLILTDVDNFAKNYFSGETFNFFDNFIRAAFLEEISKINAGGAIYAEAYIAHRDIINKHADQYDPRVRKRLLRTKNISGDDYLVAMRARDQLIDEANKVTSQFDALLMPTTPTIAPPIKALEKDEKLYSETNILTLRNTFCFNFLDRCALSIPMQPQNAAPTGLMVVGETMGDHRLLSIGLTIEKALK